MKVDNIDKKILNALIEDSRRPLKDMSKTTGVSMVTVLNRIKKLKKEGIIRKHTTILNYNKLGYNIKVTIEIKVSHGKEELVEKKMLNNDHVSAIYDITGQYDVLMIAQFRSREELNEYIKKIQTFPFVEKTKTSLILETIKEQPNMID